MEITPLTHLLQVSEKSCRKPRNTLKTQLHFDCASKTSKGSENLGEVEDYPKVLEEKMRMWLLTKHPSFLFHYPRQMAKLRMPPSVGDVNLGMRSRSPILDILYWNAAEEIE